MRRTIFAALLLSSGTIMATDAPVEVRARDAVFETCPGLAKLQSANEIVSTRSEVVEALGSIQREKLRWSRQVDITVKLADRLKSVPADWYANGQTCYFNVGHGGMVVAKKPCQRLCDLAPTSQPAIVKMPELDGLEL